MIVVVVVVVRDYDTAHETVIPGMVLVVHQVKAQTWSLHSMPDYKCFRTEIC